MSFLSVLGKIASGVQTGAAAVAPYTPIIASIPGYGSAIVGALNAIITVESLITGASSGPQKKSIVMAILQTNFPKIPTDVLHPIVDSMVAALNALTVAENQAKLDALPSLAVGSVTTTATISTTQGAV